MEMNSQHVYEVRPRKDKRGFDLISDALPLRYGKVDDAIGYLQHRAGTVIARHEHKDDFREYS